MEQTIRLGRRNRLEVLREVDFGIYLDAGEIGGVLLPRRYVPEGTRPGDTLDVFLYLDNEERLVATTETPLVQVNEAAYLEVKWTNEHGAFLDWGLMKDLFCPFGEQRRPMERGKRYVVYCYIDRLTYRIVASAKVEKFLTGDAPGYAPGDAVDALALHRTDLGMKVVVDNRHEGMLFDNELFRPLRVGDRLTAYVKQVRPDGKIDLMLQTATGRERVGDFSRHLLDALLGSPDGRVALHDKSDAADIYAAFGVSKKTFKRAVGDLYKRRYIELGPDGVRLTDHGRAAGTED